MAYSFSSEQQRGRSRDERRRLINLISGVENTTTSRCRELNFCYVRKDSNRRSDKTLSCSKIIRKRRKVLKGRMRMRDLINILVSREAFENTGGPNSSMKIYFYSAILLCVMLSVTTNAQVVDKRPITVEDSVLLRLFSANNSDIHDRNQMMAISRDGKNLVYALRETNLKKNVNEVVLYLLDLPSIIGEPLPTLGKGREVFRAAALPIRSLFRNGANHYRSNQFQWLADNKSLLVLHQPDGEKYPVISKVDTRSGKSTVVYRSGIEVTEFAADDRGEFIAVAGRTASGIPGPVQSPKGIVLTNRSHFESMLNEEYLSGKTGLSEFLVKIRDKGNREVILFKAKPVRSSVFESLESVDNLRISPDGSHLTITTNSSSVKLPESWLNDPLWTNRGPGINNANKALIFELAKHPAGVVSNHRLAFDAPGASGEDVRWSDDSTAYLFRGPTPSSTHSNTVSPQERINQSESGNQKLYAVDARTGESTLVTADTSLLQEIYAFDQNASRAIVRLTNGEHVTYRRKAGGSGGAVWFEEKHVKLNTVPLPHPGRDKISVGNDRVVIDIEEAPTIAHDLWAIDVVSGRKTRLTEVNPELNAQRMPKIERLEINGSYGKDGGGHLIYPIDYVPGKRYPAVIMMGGWGNWFVHGASRLYNDYPPLQLSAAGIVVLMLLDFEPPSQGTLKRYADLAGLRSNVRTQVLHATGLMDAKRALTEKGLIDPDRVGLMSFSGRVRLMNYALAIPSSGSKPEWAAAIGMDGAEYNYDEYTNRPDSQRIGFERSKYGGPPFGEHWKEWEKYSVARNAHKVRTPTISVYHQSTIFDSDWVTALQVQGKPVEQVWFPDVGHVIQPPQARLSWMHWAVDWMRFWLQDYEKPAGPDHDPDRYVRWRKMKLQHKWNEKLIARGMDPAQEFINLRMTGKEPDYETDTKAAVVNNP